LVVAITAAWFGPTIDRRDKRVLTIAGVLISSAASVASILVHQVSALVLCRLLVGLGCGMIAASTCALPTLHRQPERVFAYMQVTLGVQFGFANYAMGIASQLGREGLFVVELAFLVVLGACALLFPTGVMPVSTQTTGPKASPGISKAVLACVASLALLWASIMASWGFAEQAAIARGLSEKSLIGWFTISGFFAPVGGLIAAALGERYGYVTPLAVGFLFHVLSATAMYCLGGYNTYVVGIMLLNAPITFTTTYLMALLTALDKTGRGASIGGAAANFGGAVGPLLGVMALTVHNVAPVGIVAALLLLIGFALSVGPARRWGAVDNPAR
jgi:predicted MFS family arabinose efflux permease